MDQDLTVRLSVILFLFVCLYIFILLYILQDRVVDALEDAENLEEYENEDTVEAAGQSPVQFVSWSPELCTVQHQPSPFDGGKNFQKIQLTGQIDVDGFAFVQNGTPRTATCKDVSEFHLMQQPSQLVYV